MIQRLAGPSTGLGRVADQREHQLDKPRRNDIAVWALSLRCQDGVPARGPAVRDVYATQQATVAGYAVEQDGRARDLMCRSRSSRTQMRGLECW